MAEPIDADRLCLGYLEGCHALMKRILLRVKQR
jgi:hypothetical protein